jgi:translation initiation factor eIF-2B subunit alpha/methylthioribose-1-phosphate isomerase
MKINGKDYQALWREEETIHFIDQRKLPHTFEIYSARTIDDIAYAIKEMVVRGAPAIGAAAAYGMAIGNKNLEKTATLLRTTRPTAYDLFHAIEYMTDAIQQGKNAFSAATLYAQTIISCCKKIGEQGEKLIKDSMRILTHCNAGALATIDYGTALAPIRLAHENKKELFVYADETRPRLQGVLTAWELYHEGIPHVLITDNAAGYYMRKKDIDLVIVGADRIAKNGDFANKIGTYEKAVLAKENDIPFYVAAPASTFDPHLKDGSQIIIEERAKQEITQIAGKTIMPEWISVKNPAFDVTPQKYVSGYITENGIIKK